MLHLDVKYGMEGFFHVYNRTIAKEPAFVSPPSLRRMLALIQYYKYPQTTRFSRFQTYSEQVKHVCTQSFIRKPPVVHLYAYAIMPNHFHFLLKAERTDQRSVFISKIQNSFAKYYNLVNGRDGSLFQNRYKFREVKNNVDFFTVADYIHLNPIRSKLVSLEDLPQLPNTSLFLYKHNPQTTVVETDYILNTFRSFDGYLQHLTDHLWGDQ